MKKNIKTKVDLGFFFLKDSLLMVNTASGLYLSQSLTLPLIGQFSELVMEGRWFATHGNRDCFVSSLPESFSIPETATLLTLRQLFGRVDEDLYTLAGRAIQILNWDRSHRFCSFCATALVEQPGEIAKICPSCSAMSYPRLSPAVIMTVENGDEILLGRSPHFPKGMYSTLAGFVEPGETLEQAVVREVREEVNVEVDHVSYFASQPWPFPNSLMVGFTARYARGDIVLDPVEIEDARWFSRESMPKLPSTMSIARKLIDNFLLRHVEQK